MIICLPITVNTEYSSFILSSIRSEIPVLHVRRIRHVDTIISINKERIVALESMIAVLQADKRKDRSQDDDRQPKRGKGGEDKYAWKKVPPKAGKPTKFVRNKKTYNWCPKHLAWTIHTPEECKLTAEITIANATTEEASQSDKESSEKGENVSIDQAYNTIISNAGRMFE
jgi:hypothetical protein